MLYPFYCLACIIIVIPLSTDKDHRWLEWFEQKFSSLPDEIDFDQFKKILHIKEVLAIYLPLNFTNHLFYYTCTVIYAHSPSLQNVSFIFLIKARQSILVAEN